MATKQRGRESAFSVRADLDVERLNYAEKVLEKVLTFCGVCGIIIVSRGQDGLRHRNSGAQVQQKRNGLAP